MDASADSADGCQRCMPVPIDAGADARGRFGYCVCGDSYRGAARVSRIAYLYEREDHASMLDIWYDDIMMFLVTFLTFCAFSNIFEIPLRAS